MKKLKSRLRIVEIDGASDRIIEKYRECTNLHGDKYLERVVNDLIRLSEELTIAIKRQKVKSGLSQADKERGKAVQDLATLINGYSVVPVKNMSSIGKRMKQIFDKYGLQITKSTYLGESSLISSMLKDFEIEDVRNNIGQLPGMQEAINNLREAEQAFLKVSAEFDTSKAMMQDLPSATKLSQDVLVKINRDFVPYMNAMTRANEELYGDFSKYAGVIIDRTNATLYSLSDEITSPEEPTDK